MVNITNREYINNIDDFSIEIYLKQIGKASLLSVEEEQTLGKIIQEMPENSDKHKAAVSKLIQSNLRYVVHVAKKYTCLGIPIGDLIGYGNEGLIEAAHRFDYRKNVRFVTYATWWIKQAIIRRGIDDEPHIRIPSELHYKHKRIHHFIEDFKKQHHRDPTQDEVVSFESLGNLNYDAAIRGEPLFSVGSLNKPVGDDSDSSVIDFVRDSNAVDPHISAVTQHQREIINQELDAVLSHREEEIIKSRFGLDDYHAQTLEEVGLKFHVTGERIRQIENKAIRRLRKNKKKLQELL